MDFDDPRFMEAFFRVHSMLPREGPGNAASTARALELCRPLPQRPRVLDIACGPGKQTVDLARLLPDATFTALDFHRPFLDELEAAVAGTELAARIGVMQGDMAALPFAPGSFDLLWCEGAAYIMGVEEALEAWKPLLAPGGRLAFTDAVWLKDDVPERVQRNWDEYPAMTDIPGLRARAKAHGWRVLRDFVLPEAAWWDDYYTPMAARIAELVPSMAGDPVGERVLDLCREEIAVYRDHADCYGYLFLVLGL
jgi:SAM-dependent methyltransferase